MVESPDGYEVTILNEDGQDGKEIYSVAVGVSSLTKSLQYWRDVLGMNEVRIRAVEKNNM